MFLCEVKGFTFRSLHSLQVLPGSFHSLGRLLIPSIILNNSHFVGLFNMRRWRDLRFAHVVRSHALGRLAKRACRREQTSQPQSPAATMPFGHTCCGGEGIRTLGSVRITLSKRVQLTTMRHLQISWETLLTIFHKLATFPRQYAAPLYYRRQLQITKLKNIPT